MVDFSKVIELDPTNANAYKNRGVTKMKLKDKVGAKLDFNKAAQLEKVEPRNVSR